MSENNCLIGIVPQKYRKSKNLCEVSLEDLIIETGCETHKDKKIGDLTSGDHILIYPCSNMLWTNYTKLNCKVSLIMFEPYAIHAKYYHLFWLLKRKFFRIFVRYEALSNKFNNVIAMELADSWVPRNLEPTHHKTKKVSLIASNKMNLTGHKLRHDIVEAIEKSNSLDIEFLGRAYQPFEDKEDGLLPYRFSIVIENAQERDYFTEKLVDCCLCSTVPIYWGPENIGDFFDTNGIITFNTVEELTRILANLTKEDYNERLQAIEANHKKAQYLSNRDDRVIKALRNSL